MNLVTIPKYIDCFSITPKQGGEKVNGTYTWGFTPTKIVNFDTLKTNGFSPTIYKGGHRNKINSIGMTNLGYVDIDTKDNMPPINAEVFIGWLCYKSQSRKPGKFRVFYKRPFVIQDNLIVSTDGIILKDLKDYFVPDVISTLLEQERDWFLDKFPTATAYFDITSLNSHMHSKHIAEKIYDVDISNMEIVDFGFYDFEKLKIGERVGNSFNIGNITAYGINSTFERVVRGNTETLYLKHGNILEANVGGVVKKVTLGEAIKNGYQLSDPIGEFKTTGFSRYPNVGDAYMKMGLYRDKKFVYASAWGQHDGNFMARSRIVVVFKESRVDMKYVTKVTIDGVAILIDEKHKTFIEEIKEL